MQGLNIEAEKMAVKDHPKMKRKSFSSNKTS